MCEIFAAVLLRERVVCAGFYNCGVLERCLCAKRG